MKVRDCMTEQPITAQANESIENIAKIMRECDVGVVPILTEDNLVGLLTDRDITVRAAASGMDMNAHQAQEIMTTQNITSVAPDSELEEAAHLMADGKIRRLPVLIDHKLVGMLSLGDVAVAAKGNEAFCGEVLEELSEPIGPKCAM